jgi:hypothetical protein
MSDDSGDGIHPSEKSPLSGQSPFDEQLPQRDSLLIALILTASIAATNQFLLRSPFGDSPYGYVAWLVFCTASLGWVAGSYVQPEWFSWTLFAWGCVLLDALTIASCLWSSEGSQVAYALVSAHLAALIFWSILGATRWQTRLPILLVLIAAIASFSQLFYTGYGFFSRDWYQLLIFSVIALIVAFFVLRWLSFRVEVLDRERDPSRRTMSKSVQFSIRNLLIWSTALVPMLILSRTLDFRNVLGLGQSQLAIKNAVLAVSLMVVDVCLCWLILGTGRRSRRLVFTASCLIALGYANNVFGDLTVQSMPKYLSFLGSSFGSRKRDVDWVKWFALNASLLAAVILYFRASRYRLVRRGSPASPANQLMQPVNANCPAKARLEPAMPPVSL